MNVFIDTEFTRLPTPYEWNDDPTLHIGLISIGLIDESGKHQFYAEITDGWTEADCANFTIDTVLPLLEGGGASRTLFEAQLGLMIWISNLEDPVTIVCDHLVDWLWLKRLLGNTWPVNLKHDGYVLAQFYADDELAAFENKLAHFFDPVLKPQHHALNDAEGLRAGWLAAQGIFI